MQRRIALVATLAALMPSPGAAEPLRLGDLVAPKPGATACWQRQYDAAHLGAHPDQTVTDMRLGLDYFRFADDNDGAYGFGISVLRRGEDAPAGAGGLCHDTEQGVGCYVDCDGGGFLLRRAKSPGAVLLDLRHTGWLSLRDCGEEDSEAPRRPPLTPGRDDAVFLLYPATGGACLE